MLQSEFSWFFCCCFFTNLWFWHLRSLLTTTKVLSQVINLFFWAIVLMFYYVKYTIGQISRWNSELGLIFSQKHFDIFRNPYAKFYVQNIKFWFTFYCLLNSLLFKNNRRYLTKKQLSRIENHWIGLK